MSETTEEVVEENLPEGDAVDEVGLGDGEATNGAVNNHPKNEPNKANQLAGNDPELGNDQIISTVVTILFSTIILLYLINDIILYLQGLLNYLKKTTKGKEIL